MADPATARTALVALVEALEAHLSAAEQRVGEADPAVFAAYSRLAGAFVDYEDALYEAHDEVVPMSLLEDDEDDDDLDDDEDDDEDEGDDLVDVDDDDDDLEPLIL